MSDANSFAKLVPGFDFLQGLVKNAGSSMPNMGQWIAPTIDPVELDRRIQELKTVQFWLEQNARMMSATIQALEVQRMTLVTLQGMNVSVGNLQDALKIHVPSASPSEPAKAAARSTKPAPEAAPAEAAEPAPGVVDPMQWWNSLTQQFTELATSAMNAAGEAAQNAAATAASAAQTAAEAATTATANAQAAAAAAASDLVKPVRRAAAKAKPVEAPASEPAAKSPRSRRTAT